MPGASVDDALSFTEGLCKLQYRDLYAGVFGHPVLIMPGRPLYSA